MGRDTFESGMLSGGQANERYLPLSSLVKLFCDVDDFCQAFVPRWEQHLLVAGARQRRRVGQMYLSEMMTIVIHFHQSHYRDFKTYYTEHVSVHLRQEFPTLLSYSRFVYLMPQVLIPLGYYLQTRLVPTRGIAFIDSTLLAVCDNRRIERHHVFRGLAQRGKTSMGWFYGFKLHLIANDQGELVSFTLTPGNVDDRRPVARLARDLWGKLFGDKGYLSGPLALQLLDHGLELITHVRRNMAAAPALTSTGSFSESAPSWKPSLINLRTSRKLSIHAIAVHSILWSMSWPV